MQRLVLGIAVLFFVCVSSASSPQGYCERGRYIPTHIIECVTFCADHGKVYTVRGYGTLGEDLTECECLDGSIKEIPRDPQDPQCPEVQRGVECDE